jgi:NADH:ubiquinone oxidoreductase subunit 5 (subunit L)/multisubunit Na+/H+ antiporter MnhA subunit
MKAVIVNRIGDFCLYFAILLIFYDFKTLDFNVIFPALQVFSLNYVYVFGYHICLLDVVCLFLFLAAMGKSAQLGLHT